MRTMAFQDICDHLSCIHCSSRSLHYSDDKVVCTSCLSQYPIHHGVIDLVPYGLLPETATQEIKAMSLSLNDDNLKNFIEKENWDAIQTHYHRKGIQAACYFLKQYARSDHVLFAMGCGAGFEFRLMHPHDRPASIIASDISWRAARAIPLSLKEIDGFLGTIACDFNHCPVTKEDKLVGFVFEALHHSDDVHRSLESLLANNFEHIIMVEPTRNWLVNLLEHLGLTMRVEYSGLKPDWIDIKRARKIAQRLGFTMDVKTWWPIPDALVPSALKRNRFMRIGLCAVVDAFSALTSLFNFGAMSAYHFRRA